MATLKKTASGKIDKRTKEYKDLVERAKKARLARAKAAKAAATKTTSSKTTAKSSIKRRSDGKLDLRTKEGKAATERMAKARAARAEKQILTALVKKLLK